MRRVKRKFQKKTARLLLAAGILLAAACWQNLGSVGHAPALAELLACLNVSLYQGAADSMFPMAAAGAGMGAPAGLREGFYQSQILSLMPLWQFCGRAAGLRVEPESELTYEMLMARQGMEQHATEGEASAEGLTEAPQEGRPPEAEVPAQPQEAASPAPAEEGRDVAEASAAAAPVAQISREKLNDFDYLIQHFYTVDKTTTIDGSQLNAAELLSKDLRLTTAADAPQILIHHTHSQERYADSTEDPATSIVGVGAYLAKLLQEKYGFNVIHDTGEYDIIDHDNAYSYAGDAMEKILAQHPSIQVAIDVHRDSIGGDPLVAEVNGKPTAKIMFFNGLSRTTARGDIASLYNPNLQDNLAFSLQMKVAAEEYYPGFTRHNYLKGYQYNLHYLPRSMLVEVGAQNNTVEQAMNAMEPLADLLHKILAPQG